MSKWYCTNCGLIGYSDYISIRKNNKKYCPNCTNILIEIKEKKTKEMYVYDMIKDVVCFENDNKCSRLCYFCDIDPLNPNGNFCDLFDEYVSSGRIDKCIMLF